MPIGRPRKISLSPDKMIKLGEEMIEWVIKNDPIHLSLWYCVEKGYTDSEWDTMHVAPEFFPYYQKALKLVGYKYLKKDSVVDPSLKQRWQRVYFKDLRSQEDLDLDNRLEREIKRDRQKVDYEMSKKIAADIPPLADTIEKDNRIMELEAMLEKLKKQLNME